MQSLTASNNAPGGLDLLANTAATVQNQSEQLPIVNTSNSTSPTSTISGNLVSCRAREGRMRKLTTRKATQFYGGTSLFEIQLTSNGPFSRVNPLQSPVSSQVGQCARSGIVSFEYWPGSETCRELMGMFFKELYSYNMCIYREYFLRDFAAGGGPYYSDMLMYSLCATAALVSPNLSHRALSASFAKEATRLLYESLELPELTTLQSLLVLGQLEIGQGKGSKGWLFCGMACRLSHEMGLHLDPNNWSVATDSPVDREILRRVYWATFIIDKQLSLYFGRPPALYPHEADVRNTIRIPYPPEWESLLDTYVCAGTSANAFEDGVCTIGSFIHQAELAKIFHSIIVEIYENRFRKLDEMVVKSTAQNIHNALARWLAMLPQKLHWNQWTIEQVPAYVLHLHMLFHTGMIILHRPPRQNLDEEAVMRGDDVEVCYQSLNAITRLIQSYGKHYRFELLPLDFVHTLSAAAGVVMMKRHLEKSTWVDREIAKPLTQILEIMAIIEVAWPCVTEIKDGILATLNNVEESEQQNYNHPDFDLMGVLEYGPGWMPNPLYPDADGSPSDLGFLVTEDFLNGNISMT